MREIVEKLTKFVECIGHSVYLDLVSHGSDARRRGNFEFSSSLNDSPYFLSFYSLNSLGIRYIRQLHVATASLAYTLHE